MSFWFELLGGGLLLYFGAEWFVSGASALALSLRIPQIIIGLTVVAYGTSAPEIIVGIQAAADNHGDVALGNVIGSNLANIGLILGAAAIIAPTRVSGSLRKRELPVLLLSTAVLPLVLMDGVISLFESSLLLIVATSYTSFMVHAARGSARESRQAVKVTLDVADSAGAPEAKTNRALRSLVVVVVGLAVLLIGGHLFIEGAVSLATALGMSDRLVGLTVVAIGTSLPELVTSIIAALRGRSDIAVGNVVGSNIFNVFLCLPAAAFAGAIEVQLPAVASDLIWLAGITLLAMVFLRTERSVSRLEGGLALVVYGLFMLFTIVGSTYDFLPR
jgi:cation:H+ antiporter